MTTIEDRLAALESQVAALSARLDQPPTPAGAVSGGGEPAPGVPDLWALEELKRRLPGGSAGAVLYTGVVEARPGERYEWQIGAGTEDLLSQDDWTTSAGTLAALAHPVRLLLLREIIGGRRGAAELSEVHGLGTSGQIYHHLRQLVGAGWLRSAARGSYTVPPARVVPLLVILAAAQH